MKKEQVTSSNISAIGYDENNYTLKIFFKNGREFEYYQVPPNVFQELLHADSIGRYANQNIYKIYRQSRIV